MTVQVKPSLYRRSVSLARLLGGHAMCEVSVEMQVS
jgi:hypothetical protein